MKTIEKFVWFWNLALAFALICLLGSRIGSITPSSAEGRHGTVESNRNRILADEGGAQPRGMSNPSSLNPGDSTVAIPLSLFFYLNGGMFAEAFLDSEISMNAGVLKALGLSKAQIHQLESSMDRVREAVKTFELNSSETTTSGDGGVQVDITYDTERMRDIIAGAFEPVRYRVDGAAAFDPRFWDVLDAAIFEHLDGRKVVLNVSTKSSGGQLLRASSAQAFGAQVRTVTSTTDLNSGSSIAARWRHVFP